MTKPVFSNLLNDKRVDEADRRSPILLQTSLVPSDGGSPIMEAHPGSPVDLTGRRPSLATQLASASLFRLDRVPTVDSYSFVTSPTSLENHEELLRRDGVAAKVCPCTANSTLNKKKGDFQIGVKRSPTGLQTSFYIPAKVPEDHEVNTVSAPMHPSEDGGVDDMAVKFHYPESEPCGTWVITSPLDQEPRTSPLTTYTCTSEMPRNQDSPSVAPSVAGSDGSVLDSSAASFISSTISTNSTDIYGWEEELDRKSFEAYHGWERQPPRPLPSGGRSNYQHSRGFRPRAGTDFDQSQYKRCDVKRKGLLYRVLSLSRDHRKGAAIEDERVTPEAYIPASKPGPLTSAIGVDT